MYLLVSGGIAAPDSSTAIPDSFSNIILTAEEQAFLDAHPVIRLGTCEDWAPFVIRKGGDALVGFDVDILHYINAATGAKIELEVGPWDKIVSQATARKLDGLATSAVTAERADHFLFSSTYFTGYPLVAVAKKSRLFINGLEDLQGKTVAIQARHSFYRSLLAAFPQIAVVETSSEFDAASLVVEGTADAMIIGALGYYRVSEMLPEQLRVGHVLDGHPLNMVYSIRNDWPQLVSIIDKALAAMPALHAKGLFGKWFGIYPQLDRSFSPQPILSGAEKKWLAEKHEVRVRISDYPPYFFRDGKGDPAGISIDYLNRIADRAGFKIAYIEGPSWPESLEAIRERRDFDLLPTATISDERKSFLAFTREYLKAPSVIFTRKDSPFISTIEDLHGKTIVVERNFVTHKTLEESEPQISLLPVSATSPGSDVTTVALQTLASGQGDAYIGNLVAGAYRIELFGLDNLKVAAPSPFGNNNQAMAVRSDWPELASIIDKTLEQFAPLEHTEIRSRWMTPITYEYGISILEVLAWVGGSSALLLAVILLMISAHRRARAALEEGVLQRTIELQQANNDLARSNYDLESFCYSVSHDLRAPLRGISGHAGMLEEKHLKDENPEVRRHLTEIHNNSRMMGQLIDDLLTYSRITRLSEGAGPVNLGTLATECWELLEEDRNDREFDLHLEDLPPCTGYSAILKQLMFNLMNNAVKYTRNSRPAVITVGSKTENSVVIYFVQDNGIGFDMRYKDKLFGVFNRLHSDEFEGTGIGLALCKRIVERHGGRIWGEGVSGKGATFFFTLNEGIAPLS